jgi:hypothetical protein
MLKTTAIWIRGVFLLDKNGVKNECEMSMKTLKCHLESGVNLIKLLGAYLGA